MDFAWENKFGPVDENSPFLAYTNQQTAKKRKTDSTRSTKRC